MVRGADPPRTGGANITPASVMGRSARPRGGARRHGRPHERATCTLADRRLKAPSPHGPRDVARSSSPTMWGGVWRVKDFVTSGWSWLRGGTGPTGIRLCQGERDLASGPCREPPPPVPSRARYGEECRRASSTKGRGRRAWRATGRGGPRGVRARAVPRAPDRRCRGRTSFRTELAPSCLGGGEDRPPRRRHGGEPLPDGLEPGAGPTDALRCLDAFPGRSGVYGGGRGGGGPWRGLLRGRGAAAQGERANPSGTPTDLRRRERRRSRVRFIWGVSASEAPGGTEGPCSVRP